MPLSIVKFNLAIDYLLGDFDPRPVGHVALAFAIVSGRQDGAIFAKCKCVIITCGYRPTDDVC